MRIETMRGAMAVDGLGTTLMHEYVFVLTPDVMQNPPATSPEARSEPNGSYRDFPRAQPLPASGCSG